MTKSSYKFSPTSIARLSGVHPDLQKLCLAALEASPVDFGISQGVRTKEEQDALYAQGRTKPGPIVTWTKNSLHLKQKDGFCHAIDFVIFLGGKVSWEEGFYNQVVQVFKREAERLGIAINCGADWKTPDLPHIELSGSYRK